MPGQPWLFEYADLLKHLGTNPWQGSPASWLETCNRALLGRGSKLRFVDYPSDLRLSALEYERRIIDEQQIASRPDLHDALNALVWLRFPKAKLTLSALHLAEARGARVPGTRGKRRDAATLFDEHGLLFVTRDGALIEGLRNHQWQEVLVANADRLRQNTRLLVFGHALLARLATPHKGLIAHAMPVIWHKADWPSEDEWDALITARINALAQPSDLFALPVMGLPGWSDQQDHRFYEDLEVFRPLRAEHKF